MGCTHSHLDPDEEGRSASSCVRRVHGQRRRKGRSFRKASILRREGYDLGDEPPAQKPSRRPSGGRRPVLDQPPPLAQEPETKRKRMGTGPEIAGEGKGRKGKDGEELPGSPSFRIYFEGPWEDKYAVNTSEERKDLDYAEEKRNDSTASSASSSSKEHAGCDGKEENGSRFKAVTKPKESSSVVHNKMNPTC